jgi:hypothetical protein
MEFASVAQPSAKATGFTPNSSAVRVSLGNFEALCEIRVVTSNRSRFPWLSATAIWQSYMRRLSAETQLERIFSGLPGLTAIPAAEGT